MKLHWENFAKNIWLPPPPSKESRGRRIEENKHEPNILVIVTTERGKDDIFDKLVNKENPLGFFWSDRNIFC